MPKKSKKKYIKNKLLNKIQINKSKSRKKKQYGGRMEVNQFDGTFIGINPTGKSDARLLNALGITCRAPNYTFTNLKDLYEHYNHRIEPFNQSLYQAFNNLQNEENYPRCLELFEKAIDVRIRVASEHNNNNNSHVDLGGAMTYAFYNLKGINLDIEQATGIFREQQQHFLETEKLKKKKIYQKNFNTLGAINVQLKSVVMIFHMLNVQNVKHQLQKKKHY